MEFIKPQNALNSQPHGKLDVLVSTASADRWGNDQTGVMKPRRGLSVYMHQLWPSTQERAGTSMCPVEIPLRPNNIKNETPASFYASSLRNDVECGAGIGWMLPMAGTKLRTSRSHGASVLLSGGSEAETRAAKQDDEVENGSEWDEAGLKMSVMSWASAAHTCNHSYSGGRDREDCGLRPENSSQFPISKIPNTKKGWRSGSSGRAPA
jgi:hypothetical protein